MSKMMAMTSKLWRSWAVAVCLTALLLLAVSAKAQTNGLQPLDLGIGSSSGPGIGEKLKASGFFTPAENAKPAMLYVMADLAPGWHTY